MSKGQDKNESAAYLSRRRFLQWAAAGAATMAIGSGCSRMIHPFARRKPNIILLFADDQGYGELGAYGGKEIPTPNTDSIARNGVRFTDGYVSGPVCVPSRAGLLTGRYQARFGCEDGPHPNVGLPPEELTIAQRLKPLGYTTGMLGKWHLGEKEGQRPTDRGFDEFYGFLGGGHFFLPGERSPSEMFYKALSGPIYRGTEVVEEKEYLTDAFGREAVSFIDRHRDEPFFLYAAFNAVHVPLEATEKYLDRFPNISNPARRKYAAMTASLEDAVGNILAALRKNNLEEDTLIFYISDNGGHPIANTSQNGPLRGEKSFLYEGGIRIPYLMQWKGVIPAGKVYSHPVISLDFYATALAVAGGSMPTERKLDGVNLVPYVQGKNTAAPHDILYWRLLDKRALRMGDWKLVQEENSPSGELYNLADDIGETTNLAEKMPDKLREMEQAYDAMDSQMPPPGFIGMMSGARLKKQGKFPFKPRK